MQIKPWFYAFLFCSGLQHLQAQVGIGIATPHPSAQLDVTSTKAGLLIPRMSTLQRTGIANPAKGLLVFDNETTSFWFYNGASWTELVTTGSGSTNWTLNGNDIYSSNTGNVGVGTNAPATKLTIQTGINTNGWMHVGHANGIDSIMVGEAIGGVSAAMGTFTNHALRWFAGSSGKASLYPTGDFVIGDNSIAPVGKLTVKTTNNADGISHIGDGGNILKTIMGGTSAGIGTFSHTNMRIFSNGFSRIFIAEATGNVGIGTDNPTYKLSVVGNVRAYEIVVENNWADYVFDKSYKLLPLPEVEKFILQKGHLPDMPSAKEVQENGLPVGEMQKKMMAKIEELTLYVIDLEKQLKELKAQQGNQLFPGKKLKP